MKAVDNIQDKTVGKCIKIAGFLNCTNSQKGIFENVEFAEKLNPVVDDDEFGIIEFVEDVDDNVQEDNGNQISTDILNETELTKISDVENVLLTYVDDVLDDNCMVDILQQLDRQCNSNAVEKQPIDLKMLVPSNVPKLQQLKPNIVPQTMDDRQEIKKAPQLTGVVNVPKTTIPINVNDYPGKFVPNGKRNPPVKSNKYTSNANIHFVEHIQKTPLYLLKGVNSDNKGNTTTTTNKINNINQYFKKIIKPVDSMRLNVNDCNNRRVVLREPPKKLPNVIKSEAIVRPSASCVRAVDKYVAKEEISNNTDISIYEVDIEDISNGFQLVNIKDGKAGNSCHPIGHVAQFEEICTSPSGGQSDHFNFDEIPMDFYIQKPNITGKQPLYIPNVNSVAEMPKAKKVVCNVQRPAKKAKATTNNNAQNARVAPNRKRTNNVRNSAKAANVPIIDITEVPSVVPKKKRCYNVGQKAMKPSNEFQFNEPMASNDAHVYLIGQQFNNNGIVPCIGSIINLPIATNEQFVCFENKTNQKAAENHRLTGIRPVNIYIDGKELKSQEITLNSFESPINGNPNQELIFLSPTQVMINAPASVPNAPMRHCFRSIDRNAFCPYGRQIYQGPPFEAHFLNGIFTINNQGIQPRADFAHLANFNRTSFQK